MFRRSTTTIPINTLAPRCLNRPNQLSFGVVGNLPWNFQVSFIGHFYSALSMPIEVPGTGPGAIFQTDFTGDGTTQDPLPQTLNGAFGSQVNQYNINQLLTRYNNNYGNQPTPAGQVLMQNGLFTVGPACSSLAESHRVSREAASTARTAPCSTLLPGRWIWVIIRGLRPEVGLDLQTGSEVAHVSRSQPSVGFFNLFNFANFDLPPNALTGGLTGSPGSINGTTAATRITNRVGAGTGVFNLGAPRAMEFGMSINF